MSLADDLRERARIRLTATCRGEDDRLAAQLNAAADAIEEGEAALQAERAAHAKTAGVLRECHEFLGKTGWRVDQIVPAGALHDHIDARLREIGEA